MSAAGSSKPMLQASGGGASDLLPRGRAVAAPGAPDLRWRVSLGARRGGPSPCWPPVGLSAVPAPRLPPCCARGRGPRRAGRRGGQWGSRGKINQEPGPGARDRRVLLVGLRRVGNGREESSGLWAPPLLEGVKFGTHRLPRPRARCRFPSLCLRELINRLRQSQWPTLTATPTQALIWALTLNF